MDVGAPGAGGDLVVFRGDVVAVADAGGAVEAVVGLFVEEAGAVGVRGYGGGWDLLEGDCFCGEGVGG